jgi:hypothetical protein
MKIRISIIFFLIILNSSFAQDEWQVSLTAGTVSSQFLVKGPLGHQIEGRIFFPLNEDLLLTISTGWHKWQRDFGIDLNNLSAVPFMPGIKFQMPSDVFSPYFSAETGIFFITRNFIYEEYELTPEGNFRFVFSEPAEESVARFGYRVSVGAVFGITEIIGLDFSIRYSNIYYDIIYDYAFQRATSGINAYSIIAGLNFKLGNF